MITAKRDRMKKFELTVAVKVLNELMKRKTNIYHRWVAWSEEDQTYIGRCPDLFHGGTHGDQPLNLERKMVNHRLHRFH